MIMNTKFNPSLDPLNINGWDVLLNESLELSIEQVGDAAHLSATVPKLLQQWSVYLHALALLGFEQWIEEWASDLQVDTSLCSIYQPAIANLVSTACNVKVGAFKLCLLATGSFTDTSINIPKATIELPGFTPHIYVLINICEESMQAIIQGYLYHNELFRQPLTSFSLSSEDSYLVPISWFSADLSSLLLDLHCLDLHCLDRCEIPSSSFSVMIKDVGDLQDSLVDRLPQLRSPTLTTSECLGWEQLSSILESPELCEWLYDVQQTTTTTEQLTTAYLQEKLTGILNRLMELRKPIINTGLWLRDRLDNLAQDLSWVLLPAISPTPSALRSSKTEFETILSELHHQDITISPNARVAYRDLRWSQVALRLYVVIWELPPVDQTPEWSLLMILGNHSSSRMPTGIKLQVQDDTQVLVERMLTEEMRDSYLYAQVIGHQDERFGVTISLGDETAVTYSFEFAPERGS